MFIDLDNQKAIDEVCNCFGAKNLDELSRCIVVEQHKDNLSKAHLYFYSNHEFRKKSSDVTKLGDRIKNNEIPAIEVKGLGEHAITFLARLCTMMEKDTKLWGQKNPKHAEKMWKMLYLKYIENMTLTSVTILKKSLPKNCLKRAL